MQRSMKFFRAMLCLVLGVCILGAFAKISPAQETTHHDTTHSAAAHDDAHHGEDGEHAEHGGHTKPGLLDYDLGSLLWSIIVFALLLIILRVAAWKPILAGLNQREEFIRKSLSDAKHDREEAQRILADYTARVEKAHADASAIVEEGRRDSEELRKRMLAEAKTEADAALQRAKKEIGLARDDAVKQLHDQSIQLAAAIASKVVRRQLTPTDHKALLDESLAELSQLRN